ncbi:NAD(P)-dependent oxidoreductase [Sphingomonas adhaesiva]|uniref:NAD(P)-dependent oxidoreductase n=1 Tax=Sphingomonas adhaesiva TaxID=28212 RepID=UPI002FF82089
MTRLFVFGLGYAAGAIAQAAGGAVLATTRDGRGGTIRFDDAEAVRAGVAAATHVLSSVPPDEATGDPVLARYGDLLSGRWLGYLSSTGVYGDTGGGWVDESAPADRGRRPARNAADAAWLALGARVFRLPGIYGPARSALDRVAEGKANRTGVAGQVFSRVHVVDIASGVVAGFDAPPGAYNLSDDLPAPQDAVIEHAARLLGVAAPDIVPLTALSPAARAFHAENRRVANGKAKRVLGWRPRYPDYLAGLRALSATTSPTPASAAPPIASGDQR